MRDFIVHRGGLSRFLLGVLTTAAVAFFIAAYVGVHRDGGVQWPVDVSWCWIAFSVAIGTVHVAVMAGTFAWLIGLEGTGRVASVFLLAQAAKYVPGKVWGMVAQQAMLGGQSRLSRVVGANIAMAAILIASQAALVLAALLYVQIGAGPAAGAGIGLCLIAGVIAELLRRLHEAKRWRVVAPWARPRVGLVTGVASVAAMTSTGLAWATLFGGGLGYGAEEVARWTAVSGASLVAGMFSILPSGLGLREASFVAVGAQLGPIAIADGPMLALLTRAWLLATDAASVLLGALGLMVLRKVARK